MPGRVVGCAGGADDARGVRGVRLPERHLGDAVGLGDDPLGEAEGLEGLDAPGLDAVGLADGKPARRRRSTIRVVTPGNWDSCAAVSMPAGPVPTMSTSTSSGSSAGRSMPTPAAGWTRGSPDT